MNYDDINSLDKELRKELLSLLISSPQEITVKRLKTDYRKIIGLEVPFKALGYISFEKYLHSIPDTCRLIGSGEHAVVLPVISNKNKHINDAVLNQRTPTSKQNSRYVPPRRCENNSEMNHDDINSLNKELRKELKGLIISSPQEITVKRLKTDYRKIIGLEVPFKALGFISFEKYLHSIPDTCRLVGSGEHAIVLPVISDKYKDINDAVLKQRTPTSKQNSRYVPPRRCENNSVINSLDKEFRKELISLIISSPQEITVKRLKTDFRKIIGLEVPFKALGYISFEKYLHSMPDTCRLVGSGEHAVVLPVKSNKNKHINDAVLKQRTPTSKQNSRYVPPKRCENNSEIASTSSSTIIKDDHISSNLCNNDLNLYEDKEIDSDELFTRMGSIETMSDFEEDSDITESDYIMGRDELLPYIQLIDPRTGKEPEPPRVKRKIKKKIRELLMDYSEGIWTSDLLMLYKEKYNEELNPMDFEYSSVIEMCEELPEILNLYRPDIMDTKIYEIDVIMPTITPERDVFKKLSRYPDGVMLPGEFVKRQWLVNDEKVGDYIDLKISDVFDPSKFWVQIIGPTTTDQLDTVMDIMQEYYMIHAGTLQLTSCNARIGLMVAAQFLNEFHRAIIIKIYSDERIKVFQVDYGTVSIVERKRTCLLHRDFCKLPIQAIKARLSNVIPKKPRTKWLRAASYYMVDLIRQKSVIGYINSIDYEEEILDLIVTDTTLSDKDVHINDELVLQEFAEWGNEPKNSPLYNFHIEDYNYSDDDDEEENNNEVIVSDCGDYN